MSAFVLASCSDWTDYSSLDFSPASPQEQNPQAYEERLAVARAFKQTEHNISIATIEGTSDIPSSRSQHLTDIPDSVDYICIRNFSGLHPVIASEISSVRAQKGTKILAFIGYGEESQTKALLAETADYGFDGIMVSAETAEEAADNGFISAVKDWMASHPSAPVLLRGSIRDVEDKEFVSACKYHVIVAGETASPGQLTLAVMRTLGSGIPLDKVILEVTVPSYEEPEQIGATPQVAGQWVVDEKDNRNFTPQGICLGNADDDYFCEDMIYGNLRKAITIMNTAVTEE